MDGGNPKRVKNKVSEPQSSEIYVLAAHTEVSRPIWWEQQSLTMIISPSLNKAQDNYYDRVKPVSWSVCYKKSLKRIRLKRNFLLFFLYRSLRAEGLLRVESRISNFKMSFFRFQIIFFELKEQSGTIMNCWATAHTPTLEVGNYCKQSILLKVRTRS